VFLSEDHSLSTPRVSSGLRTFTIYPSAGPSKSLSGSLKLSNSPMSMEKFVQLDGRKERILLILETSWNTLGSSKSPSASERYASDRDGE